MLRGLREVEQECSKLNLPFHLLVCPENQDASSVLPKFMRDRRIGCLVTDYSPLRTPKAWVEKVKEKAIKELGEDRFCFYQVDAHNVVPVWEASDKQEYAARTIRTKINKKLDNYLTQVNETTVGEKL